MAYKSNLNFLLFSVILITFICSNACKPASSAYQFNGKSYPEIIEPVETSSKKDSFVRLTATVLAKDSSSLENWIWYGRRVAYTFDYPKAIEIFTSALKIFPDSPELYRHRGHRFISTRNFEAAIEDLEKAVALVKDLPMSIEEDGMPNKLNIPLSNLHFNIWYHLGLAYYLKGDLFKAREVYKQCIYYSNNPDLMVATIDWLYMTCKKLNDPNCTQEVLKLVKDDFEVIENEAYFNRIKMYKGLLTPDELLDLDGKNENEELDFVTQGYGVGNWYLGEGDTSKAKQVFSNVIKSNYWPAFGYIAAETALQQLQ